MKIFGTAVSAALSGEQGHTLVLRRAAASKHFAGCWEWPGGKVDAGEDFVTALRRELREETGLGIEVCGFAGASSFELPELQVVWLCMEARPTGGEWLVSCEHDDAR